MGDRIVWDAVGQHFYETGVEHGVLYLMENDGTYPNGVAFDGLTNVSESPSGGDAEAIYADNQKYLNLVAAEEFEGSIEAYYYPDEFKACNGEEELVTGITIGQQARKSFGFAYTSRIGNDIQNDGYGYKIHIFYGCVISPSSKDFETVNDSPSANTLSWDFKTTPVPVTNKRPTATLTADSTKISKDKMVILEAMLYGVTESKLPEFSATATYEVGDMVLYNDAVYVCKTKITTGAAWDSTKWTEIEEENIGPMLPTPDQVYALMS